MCRYWVDIEILGLKDSNGFDSLEAAVRYAFDYLMNNPWKFTAIRDGENIIYDEAQMIDAYHELERNDQSDSGASAT